MFVNAFMQSIFEYEPLRRRFLTLTPNDPHSLWSLACQMGVVYLPDPLPDETLYNLSVVARLMLKKKERYNVSFEDCAYMLNMWGIEPIAA